MTAEPLDRALVERLRSTGGDALVRRLLRLFLSASADAFHRIDGALDSGALPVAAKAAHYLHASAAQLNFTAVARIAERIETRALAGDTEFLQHDLVQLSEALGNVVPCLHEELGKLPKPARIAVVDDSEDIRLLLRLVLERQYDVTEYPTGDSALFALPRFPVDLLIIDVNLPDMTGIELLKFIRADTRLRDIPAIALSALDTEQADRYRSAGFALHVRKPILDTDELMATIHDLLKTGAEKGG